MGVLPPLTTVRDEQYRSSLVGTDMPVDPYAPCLTNEAAALEGKVRQEMMKSAVKELRPYTGDGKDWLAWKNGTITLFTLAGRRIVLEENYYVEAQKLGWTQRQIAEANRLYRQCLKAP